MALWTPAEITTSLWLDANDAGTIIEDSDADFANVSLLLKPTGGDGTTYAKDYSGNAVALTFGGNAAVSTDDSYFSGASFEFTGTTGDKITTPNNTIFNFGLSDFTVEVFVKVRTGTAANFPTIIGKSLTGISASSDGMWKLWWFGGDNKFRFQVGSTDGNGDTGSFQSIVSATAFPAGVWHHFAVTRTGGTVKMWIDGVEEASVADTTPNGGYDFTNTDEVIIGSQQPGSYVNAWDGFISDLRITKGTARYTTAFTPPTRSFPSLGTTHVTQWNDKSGNNLNCISYGGGQTYQATGSGNSLPTIAQDGTGFMTVNVPGFKDLTALDAYIVFESTLATAADTNTAGTLFGFGHITGTNNGYVNYRSLMNTGFTGSLSGESHVSAYFQQNGISKVKGPSTANYSRAANTVEIMGTRYGGAGVGHSMYQNGNQITVDLIQAGALTDDHSPSATGYTLDSDINLFMARSNGVFNQNTAQIKVSEYILLPTLASTEDRQRIEGYLAHKWGLTANLPASHPYKNTPPYALWTPAEIATSLWLDADDATTVFSDAGTTPAVNTDTLQQWNDKSGNSLTAVQATAGARPLYETSQQNGKPGITFAAGDYMTSTGNAVGCLPVAESNIFIVYSQSVFVLNQGTFCTIPAAGFDYNQIDAYTITHSNSGTGYLANIGGGQYRIDQGPSTFTTPAITRFEISGLGSTPDNFVKLYRDGTLLETDTSGATLAERIGGDGYALSARTNSTPTFDNFNGEQQIFELFVTGPLTPDTALKAEGYLAWKWGLEANLPADHPYKDAAPTVPDPVAAASFVYSPSFNGIIQVITNVIETVSGVGTTSYTINPNGYSNNFGGVVEALSDLNETASGLGLSPFTYALNGYSNNFKGVIEVLSDFNQTMSGVNNTSGYASNFGGIVALASDVIETVSGVGTTSFAINPSGYASNFGGVVEVLSDLNTTISGV
jgi:hypothetical protein